MRHRRTVPKLGRTPAHRKAMLRNMVTSLFREERVETTVPKAKEARRVAERMITAAKRGNLHARRRASRVVRDAAVLKKLFDEIAPRFATRPGGYTRSGLSRLIQVVLRQAGQSFQETIAVALLQHALPFFEADRIRQREALQEIPPVEFSGF